MYKRKRVTAVILAGGSGSRMGTSENKVYLPIDGKPAILYAVESFDQHPYVDALVLVTREEEQTMAKELLNAAALTKPWRIVQGGDSRQDSVRNGIAHVENEFVLIHDGARPLVQKELIDACVEALLSYDGAIVALPVEEDIYRVGKRNTPPRRLKQTHYAAQTPQGFHTQTLRYCHKKHQKDPDITDDSCLLEREGYRVGIVQGDVWNIKLTTPLDVSIMEAQLHELSDLEKARKRILARAEYYIGGVFCRSETIDPQQ